MATDMSASAIGGVSAGTGDSTVGASGRPENAYEKLSREVHQMQITGAIHTDWLENPKGFLLKPDFKRKAQHVGAGGKKLNSSRVLRLHLPGNTYRVRWFVLDGMILRYFKTSTEEQELGAIHLTSVNAVLPSSVADAPEHALDLVCADRIYTVAGNDREDMVRWATVLTLVLRGEYKPKLMLRPESSIIRGSSVIPRPSAVAKKTALTQASRFTDANGMRMTGTLTGDGDAKSQGDDDVKEKIITVTFDQPGPLHLILRGTVDDEVMVCGFQDGTGSSELGPAEASNVIRVGDHLISINNHYFTNIEFQQAVDLIRGAGRPLTLRFSRVDFQKTSSADTSRVAEGWVLSKESSAHRYRIRMLQLQDDKVKLYKPSMQGGRVDEPCLVIRMEQVTDIRPTNDMREVVSAFTQCHPKQWGVTLEGSQSIFTFYTKNRDDMVQWVDLLKNSPLFSPKATRLSIPVHPVALVEFDPVFEPKVVLQNDVGKLGDLLQTFSCHYFLLLEDGKMMYYVNASAAAIRTRPIGTIRCDNIVSIVPSQVTEDSLRNNDATLAVSSSDGLTENMMPWRLELGILIQGSSQKYRRPFIMCFSTQEMMMKWGIAIGKEAKRLTGQEYDLSSISRRASRSNSLMYASRQSEMPMTRPTISRLISNPAKYVDPNVLESSRLYRSLKDVTLRAATRGWFFVKKPRSVGLSAYHPRFLVLIDNQLMFFKYEVLEEESLHSYASMLDLRNIKDVREAESGFQENLDFTIQLSTANGILWMLVAENYAQKEAWLSALIWLSDYYYRAVDSDDGITTAISDAKRIALNTAGIMVPISEFERPNSITSQDVDSKEADRLATAGITKERISATSFSAMLTDDFTGIGGDIQIAGKRVFAAISSGVFRYYESQSDYESEWGDAIDAISLKDIEEVHSDGLDLGSFVVKVNGEKEVRMVAESVKLAKRWMLVMCCCGDLVLKKVPHADYWASTKPKEAWIWKLDRLYQIFRRRYFSLRNHQLVFYTGQGGRMLGMISLPCIFHLQMSKVWTRSKDEADFYQLEVSFAVPTAAEESSRTDQIGDFYAFLLAFDTEKQLKEWASAIYDCCTNSMSLKGNATLSPLGDIQVLPKELLKTSTFDHSDDAFFETTGLPVDSTIPRSIPKATTPTNEFSSSGWLYYRTSKEERIRLRYFMQWGYELSIFKHEVLADEVTAIRYGVIDCRALVDVRFAYINSPENAVELILGSKTSVIIIPRTDQEAVMWRNSLLDVKRAYGTLECGKNKEDTFGSGVFISHGSTFSAHRDNEDLLRSQIESTVIYSSNLQDWDGRNWIPKYFVLTSSRVLIMSLALHLYDEEPDILGSFATKDIVEVRACNENEEAETGHCKSACVVMLRPQSNAATSNQMVIKCDSIDHCLKWMRLLCSSNGKLELKKNAATGYWGSVNRIASLSRHQSFLASAPLSAAIADANPTSRTSVHARRMTRQDAARKRTSELIMNRKSIMGT